jgi:hypothetical protein
MDHQFRATDIPALAAAADRLDSLAEIAELMNDPDGGIAFRDGAAQLRLQAMSLLDD